MTTATTTDAALQARYSSIFDEIAKGAVEREQNRALAHDAVRLLKETGFTALRVPKEYGGGGVTLPQFLRLLTRLAEADSNLPQIIRAHSGFIEQRLESDNASARDRWFAHIVKGETIGAATSERTGSTHNSVSLTQDHDNRFVILNGEKYYSTGTLYSEWVNVAAHDSETDLHILVRSDSPGVHRLDDWDGFGQRLTASGTTRLDNVRVPVDQVVTRYKASEPRRNSLLTAFYQTVHLATLAGIARAILRDGVAFVNGRTRTFGVAGQSSPRDNPLVHRVVGRLASLAYSTQALVDAVGGALENVHQARIAGTVQPEQYVSLDIEAFQAQQIVLEQVLEAATLLFEVGGATATSSDRRFDRHWRNARVIASHNPAIQREAAVGNYHLNGTAHDERFSLAHSAKPETKRENAELDALIAGSGR